MSKWVKENPTDFERYFKIQDEYILFQGFQFFDTRENCKAAAKVIRKEFGIMCRSVVIPESTVTGGAYGGYPERYLVMIEPRYVWGRFDTCIDGIWEFLEKQEGAE
jgi:hypothetical protein